MDYHLCHCRHRRCS